MSTPPQSAPRRFVCVTGATVPDVTIRLLEAACATRGITFIPRCGPDGGTGMVSAARGVPPS